MQTLFDIQVPRPPRVDWEFRLRAAWGALRGRPVMVGVALVASEPIHIRHFDHGVLCCNSFTIPRDSEGVAVYVSGNTPDADMVKELFKNAG